MTYAWANPGTGAAIWLDGALGGRPGTVGALVPPAERVLWIRHPAHRGDVGEPVRWAEVVPDAGFGPAVQFADLVGTSTTTTAPRTAPAGAPVRCAAAFYLSWSNR